jgi:hypothetical protein
MESEPQLSHFVALKRLVNNRQGFSAAWTIAGIRYQLATAVAKYRSQYRIESRASYRLD